MIISNSTVIILPYILASKYLYTSVIVNPLNVEEKLFEKKYNNTRKTDGGMQLPPPVGGINEGDNAIIIGA